MTMDFNFLLFGANLLQVYSVLILLDVVVSWAQVLGARGVSSYHPIVRTLRSLTGPALAPIRRCLPPHKTSGWDLSPFIVLVAIQMLQQFLVRAAY